MNKAKNGLDLLLLLNLIIETMEVYQLKGVVKNKANLFKRAIEPTVTKGLDEQLLKDEEFIQNALSLKARMISEIADLNEADQILLSEFVHNFVNNIDLARQKGSVFFNKLL